MQTQARSDLVPVGEQAPDFDTGLPEIGRLSDLRGKKQVVLVFYPGDGTPTCTAQLCALRDNWAKIEAAGALVLGINPAHAEKHNRFATKYHFPFPLVADAGGHISALYGCRALFGLLTRRTVYVIDSSGRVTWAKRGNPTPAEILEILNRQEEVGWKTEPK